jgi:ATP-binding cassette subfamily B protein
VDARAEDQYFRRFASLAKGRTTTLIYLRFSTVFMADRILVLQRGGLVESGNHQDLLTLSAPFCEIGSRPQYRMRHD